MTRPVVCIVATGGTIASKYVAREGSVVDGASVEELTATAPEIADFAEVRGYQHSNVTSDVIETGTIVDLGRLLRKLVADPTVTGVVVTHGTATLEETAYFLNLTVKSDRPVVVTGAMRPPSAISSDAELNLLDAIRVAASPAARGMGTLVVMNNEIQAARDVAKSDALRVQTMTSRALGLLGYADADGQVVFFRAPTRAHTVGTAFDVAGMDALPRVDIVQAYGGTDGLLVRALVDAGVTGIVAAGLGSGSGPSAWLAALDDAVRRGVKVMIATQSPDGRVLAKKRFADGGYIVADNLGAKKARILLMLGLAHGADAARIQQWAWTC